jgi:hypothetical protein
MPDGTLRYDRMVEDALKGVMRQCLSQIAKRGGFPGGHHFYITFRTRHPGVAIPDHLLARYPEEITIVLQHQFWGLEVEENGFSVVLAFNGVRESLRVPYAAVSAFADPSVKFGLQFQVETATSPAQPAFSPAKGGETAAKPPGETAKAGDKGAEKGQIIALDAFRKK